LPFEQLRPYETCAKEAAARVGVQWTGNIGSNQISSFFRKLFFFHFKIWQRMALESCVFFKLFNKTWWLT